MKKKIKYINLIIFVLIFDLAIQLLMYGDLYHILKDFVNDESFPAILAFFIEIPVFYFIYRKIKIKKNNKSLKLKEVLGLCLGLIGITAAWLFFCGKVLVNIDIFKKSLEEFNKAFSTSGETNLILSLIAISFLGPIMEELFFRGVILESLKKISSNKNRAIIIQALLFAIFHLSLVQGIYAFVGGLVFGLVSEECSLKDAIKIHMLNNFLSSLLPELEIPSLDKGFQIFALLFIPYLFYKIREIKNPSKS